MIYIYIFFHFWSRSLNEVSEDGEEEYASDGERALTGESNKIKGKNHFDII